MQYEKIHHLDLFSGVGGFALATEQVFGKENVDHIFCDNEPFSQAILRKHWPRSPIFGDIREISKRRLTADTLNAELEREKPRELKGRARQRDRDRRNETLRIDLLTGGFPCQPFSAAGRRRGTEDDRHLWPEMLRVIRETNPRWVLGENVGGFLTWNGGLVFDQVCADLEKEGYEVCPLVIPAVAVNTPHRRDRVWIAAFNPQHPGRNGTKNSQGGASGSNGYATRTNKDEQPARPAMARVNAANTRGIAGGENGLWSEDWSSAAARLCALDDGLPDGLARPKGWRNAALKGAGNAIVPQVAERVIRAMFSIQEA